MGNRVVRRYSRDREKQIEYCYNWIIKHYNQHNIKCILYNVNKALEREIRKIYGMRPDDIPWIFKGLIRYAFLNRYKDSEDIKYRYFLGSSSRKYTFASRVKIVSYSSGSNIKKICSNCFFKIFCRDTGDFRISEYDKYLLLFVEDFKLEDNTFFSDKLDEVLRDIELDGKNIFERIWVKRIEFT